MRVELALIGSKAASAGAKVETTLLDFLAEGRNQAVLVADLQAARWVAERPSAAADDVQHFLALHDSITTSIFGRVVSALRNLDPAFVAGIVVGWRALFRAGLEDLRIRYGPPDGEFRVNAVDWSAVLGLSLSALARLPSVSRYAEYWAEMSVSNSSVRATLQDRLDFIGSPLYVRLSQLVGGQALLLFDQKALGVPSYDLVQHLRAAPAGPSNSDLFRGLGWHAPRITAEAEIALNEIRGVEILATSRTVEERELDRSSDLQYAALLDEAETSLGMRAPDVADGSVATDGRGQRAYGVQVFRSAGIAATLLLATHDDPLIELCRHLWAKDEWQSLLVRSNFEAAVRFVFRNQSLAAIDDSGFVQSVDLRALAVAGRPR